MIDGQRRRTMKDRKRGHLKYQISFTFDLFNKSVYEKDYKLLKYGIGTISYVKIGKRTDAIWVHLIIVQNPKITIGYGNLKMFHVS